MDVKPNIFQKHLVPKSADAVCKLLQKSAQYSVSSNKLKVHVAATATAVMSVAVAIFTVPVLVAQSLIQFSAHLISLEFNAAFTAFAVNLMNAGRCLLYVALGSAFVAIGIFFPKIYTHIAPLQRGRPNVQEQSDLQKRLAELQDLKVKTENRVAELEKELESAQTKLQDAEQAAVDSRSAARGATPRADLSEQLKEAQEKVEELEKALQDQEAEAGDIISSQSQIMVSTTTNRVVGQRDAFARLRSTIKALEDQLAEKDIELKEAKEAAQRTAPIDSTNHLEQVKSELADAKRSLTQLQKELASVQQALKKSEQEVTRLQNEITDKDAELRTAKDRVQELEDLNAKTIASTRLDPNELASLVKIQKELADRTQELAQLQAKSQAEVAAQGIEIARLKDEVQKSEAAGAVAIADLRQRSDEIAKAQEDLIGRNTELQQLRAQLQSTQQDQASLTKQLAEAQAEIAKLRAATVSS